MKFTYVKSKSVLLEINYQYALYYRNVRNLTEAENYINKCLKYCDYRAFNKFQIQQLNFDIKIKQGKYKEAGNIFQDIYLVSQYEFLDENDKSAWAIREAYLFYIFSSLGDISSFKYLPNYSDGFSYSAFLERTKKSSKEIGRASCRERV